MFGLAISCGVIGVLLLDTLGSLLVRGDSRRYAALAPISYLIWLGTGVLAARLQSSDIALAVARATLAGAIVGFIDATVGWWISTSLRATPMLAGQTWELRVRRVSTRVAVRAAIAGAVGGVISVIF